MRQIVIQVLSLLGSNNFIFSSEADFRFAFAWELKKFLPSAQLFFEYDVLINTIIYRVDLVVEDGGKWYYFEFKYQTSACCTNRNGVIINLSNKGAQDLMRYDYLKDIHRLETIKRAYPVNFGEGFAIILTNDRLIYSSPKSNACTLDYLFRIHDRGGLANNSFYPIPGQVVWNNAHLPISHWTRTGKRSVTFAVQPINTIWTNYSSFTDLNNISHDFKYLLNCI